MTPEISNSGKWVSGERDKNMRLKKKGPFFALYSGIGSETFSLFLSLPFSYLFLAFLFSCFFFLPYSLLNSLLFFYSLHPVFIRVILPEALLQRTWGLPAGQQRGSLRFFRPLSRWSARRKGSNIGWHTVYSLVCKLCSNCCLSGLRICRGQAAWSGAYPIPDCPVYNPSYPAR